MIEQFDAPYIGMANMYAMPVAVGGVDFPGQVPWRRVADDEPTQVPLEEPPAVKTQQEPAATVDLFAFLRGTARHILAQFRRNWSYIPGLFNLWFQSEINLGASLRVATKMQVDKGCDFVEEDAATAAAGLVQTVRLWVFHRQQWKAQKNQKRRRKAHVRGRHHPPAKVDPR